MGVSGSERKVGAELEIPMKDLQNGGSYSRTLIRSYDRIRHIPLSSAYDLVGGEDYLDENLLKSAVENKEIYVYDFDGKKYLDRLDVGRIYESSTLEREGLRIRRYFSEEGRNPLDCIDYEKKDLEVRNIEGKVIFEMNAEFPRSWDENTSTIVAQRYFFNPSKDGWKSKISEKIGTEGERSIKNLITRVTNFFVEEGDKLGYFESEEDKESFRDELLYLQINRMAAFNSPVQFNAGIFSEYGIKGNNGVNYFRDPKTGNVEKIRDAEYLHPQSHACFIKGPRDDLESILNHVVREGAVFSLGSGIGQNMGVLREEGATLSGGGTASGPISFEGLYDKGAGTIKSGGKSRRAARMTNMNYDHLDVMDFVRGKVREDLKALTLIESGKFSGGMDGEAYTTVAFQNTNHTVRVDNYFFEQLEKGGEVELRSVLNGGVVDKVSADRMLKEIAFGSWRIGDPAIQYSGEIDKMHTCPNSGRQNSTNPCGEYMFLDDTSCNLASINLLAFSDSDGKFDVKGFKRAIRTVCIAQDIANDASSYPMRDTAEISPEFRTIGIGFAGLGNLLMRRGVSYDSDEGRALTGAISAVLTGTAYETSTELARGLGPFTHFNYNKEPMMEVMRKHKKNLEDVLWEKVPEEDLEKEARAVWERVIERGSLNGFRNAQVSVIAPTGTISYLMGVPDSTGIEPSASLVIHKNLAGGGRIKIINSEVKNALRNLGYGGDEILNIEDYILDEVDSGVSRGSVVGAPHLNPDHYSIFDTAFGGFNGVGSILSEGHVRMMGAAQPFISGGISKTNNLPETATVKDVYDTFVLGKELGLKGITVFRNNSKPISAIGFGGESQRKFKRGEKRDIPNRGDSFRTEVKIGGTPFLINVGEYEDGTPGEVVINSYKAGSSLGALLKLVGVTLSKSLKSGSDLEYLVEGYLGEEMEPKGLVSGHPYIKTANSPADFLAKMLLLEYKGRSDLANDPDSVDFEDLRGFSSGAFRTYSRREIDEWDIDQVLEDAELGGFVEGKGNGLGKAIEKSRKRSGGNSKGVICDSCGNLMIQTSANCYDCKRCGDKVGGCGF